MGQLDMASALRSMAAAACLAASSANSAEVQPSPKSTCESPQAATLTTSDDADADAAATDQPLNLSTSKKSIFSSTNLPPLAKIDRGKGFISSPRPLAFVALAFEAFFIGVFFADVREGDV